MKKINVAVVGLGRIGKIHLNNLSRLLPGAEVIATMDPLEESVQIAREYGIPTLCSTIDELLALEGLDAVVVCSPTDTHATFTMKALEAGLHVFCEKPLDLSLQKVDEIVKVAENSGRKLMVGFNRRFDPDFEKVRELVANGSVGDPQIVRITSRDPGPPPITYIKRSGGIFLDMTIHDFDMARYISGKEVKEVFAAAAVKVDRQIGKAGDYDTAVITLVFEDDSLAVIDNSRKAVYGYDQRLEVFGSAGMALAENNFPNNHRLYTQTGISGDLPLHFFLERYQESYRREMQLFIEALTEEKQIPAGAQDGLMSIATGLAAKKSAELNRPVKISEIMNELK
jgi:myo-inositol 2-dehydrogenase/D-chiro-inositol 1-dehydrogenase